MTHRVYLDWNATAPILPEARDVMIAALDAIGNPSSIHTEGRRARYMIEQARSDVARLVGAEPTHVAFTSGATEANNWVIRSGWDTVIASDIEHDSVLSAIDASGAQRVVVPAERSGLVSMDAFGAALDRLRDGGRTLAVLQLANNETGVVQPVADVVRMAAERGVPVLCDAVQAAGRIAFSVTELGASFVTLSAHKIGGPKGIGALVSKPGQGLSPLLAGGGQERRQRAGTENVAAIVGFGAAARIAKAELVAAQEHLDGMREQLEAGLRSISPSLVVLGHETRRLPNTTCVAVPGQPAELLVAAFDLAGFAISSGAACSSGKVVRSRVLQAMGYDDSVASASLRISVGRTTTADDITAFLRAWHTTAAVGRRAA
jgi:cysteine desulfurase